MVAPEDEEEEQEETPPPDLVAVASPPPPPPPPLTVMSTSAAVLTATPGVRLVDAPVLLLLHFHNALRKELADLCRVAAECLESGGNRNDLVPELRRRFAFLELVYKCHSASEDEVFFRALDVHIKNVVSAYSLEHNSTDDILDSVFRCLDVLKKEGEGDGDVSKPLQELVSIINALQIAICKHMTKEEEQVFPLLTQQFSTKEQNSLVWQFMCSIPLILLEDFFQWMNSFLSSDEKANVLQCLKEVVPKDLLLQEVVISCCEERKHPFLRDFDIYGKGYLFLSGRTDFHEILEVYTSEGQVEERNPDKERPFTTDVKNNPLDGAHLWHSVYHEDMLKVLEELYSVQHSQNYSGLIPVIYQLKFFTDIVVFYSKALDKLFYSMCINLDEDCSATSYQRFLDESQIEGLQWLLFYEAENVMPQMDFVKRLCDKLEICVRGIHKYLTFVEREVFSVIVMNCSHEMQRWLLCKSLEMMPLGLLKCTITWLSTHLSEGELKSILCNIRQGGLFVGKSFSSLLYEWVRAGYLGKTSVVKFREDLQEVFKNRSSFFPDQTRHNSVFQCLQMDLHLSHKSESRTVNTVLSATAKNGSSGSSSATNATKKYDTSYSSGINFHVFFPHGLKIPTHFSTYQTDDGGSSFRFLEPKPVDHIFFFHKALKKDMEDLLFLSEAMAEDNAFFTDFYRRFHLVRFLYQTHSDAEDEIVFPVLEAKAKFRNSSHSYSIDHKLEVEHFNQVSSILDQISELRSSVSTEVVDTRDQKTLTYHQLCMKLHDMCRSMSILLSDHMDHEEIELWPLFRDQLSLEEQEKIIGCMLGRTKAETLQEMIPWLMASLTPDEQNAMMSLWRKATKNTMFDQWLGEWWEGVTRYGTLKVAEVSVLPPPSTTEALELVSKYLHKEGFDGCQGSLRDEGGEVSKGYMTNHKLMHHETSNYAYDKEKDLCKVQGKHNSLESNKICSEVDKQRNNEKADTADQTKKGGNLLLAPQDLEHQEELLKLSQEEMEAIIRRVYCDSTLDPREKSIIIQNMLMSRWINTQRKSHPEVTSLCNEQEIPGISPSYREPHKLVFGCKHYKRNCKLVASCCNKLYTCRHCHDDTADHSMDRKATTMMMCMKCLIVQPIGATCSTASCNNLSMARYYCRICKLFDDERQIYHCPYCNLCRVGKGLGIDYFHCMNCNACMARSLSVHKCREKCFEDNCPICHEYIFTSSSPIKALPCGHLMHSSCFQDYTCSNYTCPICSKSLGDMHVYFGMLDAMLAEEKIPEEYSGRTQDILCNDCEKRGTASFHWLYHKCRHCGSYNTRLL